MKIEKINKVTEVSIKKNSLSIILPVDHESLDVKEICTSIVGALSISGIDDYEVLIVSQVNCDQNNAKDIVETIENLCVANPNLHHINNSCFVGLGTQYRQGISGAIKDYVMLIPPYRLFEESSLAGIMLYLGQTDTIFTYPSDTDNQLSEARYISKSYSALCSLLFATNLKSYTGISVVKRELLSKIPIRSNDSTCLTEIAVYLIKIGLHYLELPYITKHNTNIERYKNIAKILEIVGSLSSLFWRICIKEERSELTQGVVSQPVVVMPTLNDASNISAIYQFASSNTINTFHQILVYLAKSIDRYFCSSQNSKSGQLDNWSPAVQDAFSMFRVIKVVNSVLSKVIATVSIVDSAPNKIKKRKRRSRKKGDASLTVIMPAYNEADKLSSAHERAKWAICEAGVGDYEIILITNVSPDGSHDGTPDIAANIVQSDEQVRHIHNDAYVGLGFKYRQGVSEAKKEYAMMIPGDGEFDENSVAKIISHIGKSDIIIPYISNQEVRPEERQTTSRIFTLLCNKLFGLNLRYYNGICIIPTDYLRAVPMSCDNFAYMAEILIYLLKSGANYLEVPWKIKRVEGSKAFRPESVNEVLETMSTLFWKVNVEGVRVDLLSNRK